MLEISQCFAPNLLREAIRRAPESGAETHHGQEGIDDWQQTEGEVQTMHAKVFGGW